MTEQDVIDRLGEPDEISPAGDESLLILRDDFDDNGDLLPAVATQ